jgi:hypothetical protein
MQVYGQSDITKVEDVFRFYAKAPTNKIYNYKQFQNTRRMRDAGFVASVSINAYTLVVGNPKETVRLEDTHVDGR